MSEPLAYFITWTTYGSWLPGDERGWIRHDSSGVKEPENAIRYHSQDLLKETPALLSQLQRELVDQTIREHAARR
ncbi:MAG: hypothetical protein P8M30_01860 [Planctomycetaceae bacterium]|nr:hypothetical protein [bacterium]MDC0307765.1 hypothetical protein [Planctomycetaceae bacterium]MDG2388041.1 hypothetical protein [Planctomycetaceae bacterium]